MSESDHDRPRTSQGKFVATQESHERDAQAIRMRGQGWSFQAISDRLGYGGESNVRRAIKAAKLAVIMPSTQELIEQGLAQLDYLINEALSVLQTDQVTVCHGRVTLMGEKPADGEPDGEPRKATGKRSETASHLAMRPFLQQFPLR